MAGLRARRHDILDNQVFRLHLLTEFADTVELKGTLNQLIANDQRKLYFIRSELDYLKKTYEP